MLQTDILNAHSRENFFPQIVENNKLYKFSVLQNYVTAFAKLSEYQKIIHHR